MTAPEEFRCDECGAEPGVGCTYTWPSNVLRPYAMTVYRPADGHRWDYVAVEWDGYSPYAEQVLRMERLIQIGGGEIQWSMDPKHKHYDGPLAKKYARVGTPTTRPHNARYDALWYWERATEQRVILEYMQQWLEEFGDIFALDSAG